MRFSAALNGLQERVGAWRADLYDWLDPVPSEFRGPYDLILANPPYQPTAGLHHAAMMNLASGGLQLSPLQQPTTYAPPSAPRGRPGRLTPLRFDRPGGGASGP